MEKEMTESLRDLPVTGFIRFSIKAENTARNQAIHDGFKLFAEQECGNDYTLALETLLKYYQDDARIESLWENYKYLRDEVDSIKVAIATKTEQPKDEDEGGAF
jgi:hypothetical protein